MHDGGKLYGYVVGAFGCAVDDRIYCCHCKDKVQPEFVTGEQIYPHRGDLKDLPFWRCVGCGNYVGCHHKTGNPTKPLGNIPTPELRAARKHIHALLDPLWKAGKYKRTHIYTMISDHMGFGYHTAQIRTIEEARKVYKFVKRLKEHHAEANLHHTDRERQAGKLRSGA